MITPWIDLLAAFTWVQRALLVLLTLVPLVVVTLALVPALVILPFLPSRSDSLERLIRLLPLWSRGLLLASRGR